MEEYEEVDYARSGFIIDESVTLPEGPMPDFSHSIEPHLRQLGMPTALQKGVVTLLKEYVVCKKGQALTPEQARILVSMIYYFLWDNIVGDSNTSVLFQKLLGKPVATFKLTPLGLFSKKYGYKLLSSQGDAKENIEQMEVEETEETDNTGWPCSTF